MLADIQPGVIFMKSSIHRKSRMRLLACAKGLFLGVLALTSIAQAQWAWKESNGTTVYSDRAPPADIKAAQILKRPGQTVSSSDESAPPAENKPATNPGKSFATLDAESKKRKLESAELERKHEQEQKRTEQIAVQCERLRQSLVPLQNGSRMRTLDGGVMEDSDRNAEISRVQSQIAEHCK
jgi:hypothetical protein